MAGAIFRVAWLGAFFVTLIPDFGSVEKEAVRALAIEDTTSLIYRAMKRGFDLFFCTIFLFPAMLVVLVPLLVLNPIFNPGPLFFRQKRMGRNCVPFRALKFRTMVGQPTHRRGPDDPLEMYRITRLGRFLRLTRFDELPQVFNVYLGEMSLIGPRPDYFAHAHHYIAAIPDYRHRYAVRPGISGLAQIQLGYAQGIEATRRKTAADIDYIRNASFALDMWIFWRTMVTVWRMRGS